MNTSRSAEVTAFLDALQHSAPETLSACQGWTTHEITAHLAAGAAEVSRHLVPFLAGDPVPATQSFEVREAPYRQMDDRSLRRRLDEEETKMRSLVDEVLDGQPDAVIPWTGRQMPVAKFVPHMRSEFAIHRWDFAGEDKTSQALLGQPELLEHAVGVLGPLLVRRGTQQAPRPGEDFAVRLRCEGRPDVRLAVADGQTALTLTDGHADEPFLDCGAAGRLLTVWGRRPDRRGQLHSHMPPATLDRLQALLAGY